MVIGCSRSLAKPHPSASACALGCGFARLTPHINRIILYTHVISFTPFLYHSSNIPLTVGDIVAHYFQLALENKIMQCYIRTACYCITVYLVEAPCIHSACIVMNIVEHYSYLITLFFGKPGWGMWGYQ